MRTLTVGIIGAAALAAGLLLVRQQKEIEPHPERPQAVPAGETLPASISLERIRELGY